MAKLVIKLGALDDLVSQLKRAAMGDAGHGMRGNGVDGYEYGDEDDEMEKYESDKRPQFYWKCEQDGTMVHTPTPKEYMRCPVDNAEMKKVGEEK